LREVKHVYQLAQWYGAPIAMIAVSAAFFFASRNRSFRQRLLVSAHGMSGAVLYVGAFAVASLQPGGYRPSWAGAYATLYLVPLALIGVSILKFQGAKLIHALQVLNLGALTWALFVGTMAVTGDWL
jgi:hypothetical protein